MRSSKKQISPVFSVFVLLIIWFSSSLSEAAPGQSFKKIVIFGTSLSDPGNAYVVLTNPESFGFDQACNPGVPANVPPYDMLDALLIPDGVYARGGHHVSNGATWIEQLARSFGLSGDALPALRDNGAAASNYATGGARSLDFDCRFNLTNQFATYLGEGSVITADTLFVFEMGGNDIRDAMVKLSQGEDVSAVMATVIIPAISNVATKIQELYGLGGRKFLLVNVPAVGETPALKALDVLFPGSVFAANSLTAAFNAGLVESKSNLESNLPGIEVHLLDLFGLLNTIIATPEVYGITNTQAACITPNEPPFQCKNPDSYLFWDGLHPTKVVHGIIAQKAAEVLLTPTP